MDITLDQVRQTLRKTLGFESFTAGFIKKVQHDDKCQTASISKNGTLRYNHEFVSKNIKTSEDLFSLIFHETLHKVFGHFIYQAGMIENIAADAIINAVISNLYSRYSNNGELFKRLYDPTGLTGLLRPDSNMRNNRYSNIYDNLYRQYYSNGNGQITTGELITSLKILTDQENIPTILLLGNHSQSDGAEFPNDIAGKIASDIQTSINKNGSFAGYNETLKQLFIRIIKSRFSLPRKILERYTTKRKIDRFKELYTTNTRSTSPIPIYPSKRDIILIASGVWPAHFHNRQMKLNKKDIGIAIYLDVSGSVSDFLPEIIGVIGKLQNEVITLFQFSNKVVETSLKQIQQGFIETTYGTDFDCIAESIIQRKFDKAVIITDGYASLSDEHTEILKKQRVKILTILFDGKTDCPELEPFGDVIQLDDIS